MALMAIRNKAGDPLSPSVLGWRVLTDIDFREWVATFLAHRMEVEDAVRVQMLEEIETQVSAMVEQRRRLRLEFDAARSAVMDEIGSIRTGTERAYKAGEELKERLDNLLECVELNTASLETLGIGVAELNDWKQLVRGDVSEMKRRITEVESQAAHVVRSSDGPPYLSVPEWDARIGAISDRLEVIERLFESGQIETPFGTVQLKRPFRRSQPGDRVRPGLEVDPVLREMGRDFDREPVPEPPPTCASCCFSCDTNMAGEPYPENLLTCRRYAPDQWLDVTPGCWCGEHEYRDE